MPEYAFVLLSWFIMLGPKEGKQEAALATYKQAGTEKMLSDYADRFPASTRQAIANSAIIGAGVVNHYITYTWSF